MHSHEKRSHTRVPANIEVTCTPVNGGAAFQALVRDISLGGLFLEAAEKPRLGERLALAMELPGFKGPPAQLEAYVRWTRNEGIGLQFGLLGARETHWLTELMKRAS